MLIQSVGASSSLMTLALRGTACSLMPTLRHFASLAQATHTQPTNHIPGLAEQKHSDFHIHDLQNLTHGTFEERLVPLRGEASSCLTGSFGSDCAFRSVTAQSQPANNMLTQLNQMRNTFPPDAWQHIQRLFPDRYTNRPVCVDVAVGADGTSAVELAQKGFHVIGVEADASVLAKTFAVAQHARADIELMTAKVERSLLHNNSADMVTFLHGLHMVADIPAALQEAWRILKPNGKLVAAWNDRDLGSNFASELEDIVEKHIPTYSRFQKQRSMEEWGDRLKAGGLFKLVQFSVYRHPMMMSTADSLVDLLNCMSFVRGGLRGEGRRRFNGEVKSMIERRYGCGRSFAFPLETKMYVLNKVADEDS